MNSVVIFILAVLLCYAMGSIPSGILIAKLFRLGNLRQIGSGNIGATNVVRAGGKLPETLILLVDILKIFAGLCIAFTGWFSIVFYPTNGLVSIAGSNHVFQTYAPWVFSFIFLMPILGHCYSIWLQFNGGKGVAAVIGSYLSLDVFHAVVFDEFMPPIATLVFIVTWASIFKMTRTSSIAGISSSIITLAVIAWFVQHRSCKTDICFIYSIIFAYFCSATALVIFRHKDNIRRLLRGEELGFLDSVR